jgi:septum formation protein
MKLMPGVRLNFGKETVGLSFGVPGARYTINSKGRRTFSSGIPGTGLYNVETLSSGRTSSRKKAAAFELADDNTIVITSDTVVWINDHVLNKPEDEHEARVMLRELSGRRHEVYTGVCLKSKHREEAFAVRTDVWFKELSDGEIDYYIKTYQPFDKAGAYGAQEWIGYIGVERIEGSYFNVMGLPVKELYERLVNFDC